MYVESYIKVAVCPGLILGCKSLKISHSNSWEQFYSYLSASVKTFLLFLNSCAYGMCDLVLLQEDNFILLKLK